MRRRAMIKAVGAASVVGTAGCMGGGEVVAEIQRSVRIEPGQYWSQELPDVSEPGGSIEYGVSAERAFDLYLFTSGDAYATYRARLRGETVDGTPTGHDRLSTTAVPADDGETYRATTDDEAREPLGAEGPYYFVVDHTDYAVGQMPGHPGDQLRATIDLTLVRNRF
jgi:hypothetical protein